MNSIRKHLRTHFEPLHLASLPTPLREATNLARYLGPKSPQILIKLDNLSSFGGGGNKVRKLEYELGGNCLDGVTHLVTLGGPQSNHARVTAALAAKLGLGCTLVLNGPEPVPPMGNAILHRLFGAEVRYVNSREERTEEAHRVIAEVAESGGNAKLVPLGASTARGLLGYVAAMEELLEQLETGRFRSREGQTWIVVATSSCGTTAGLLLGLNELTQSDAGINRPSRKDIQIVAVSADASESEIRQDNERLMRDATTLLNHTRKQTFSTDSLGQAASAPLVPVTRQVGAGYGIETANSKEAIQIFAQREGLLLDPVYTGKAAAEVIQRVRSGEIEPHDRVVFLHTGGEPALFR